MYLRYLVVSKKGFSLLLPPPWDSLCAARSGGRPPTRLSAGPTDRLGSRSVALDLWPAIRPALAAACGMVDWRETTGRHGPAVVLAVNMPRSGAHAAPTPSNAPLFYWARVPGSGAPLRDYCRLWVGRICPHPYGGAGPASPPAGEGDGLRVVVVVPAPSRRYGGAGSQRPLEGGGARCNGLAPLLPPRRWLSA